MTFSYTVTKRQVLGDSKTVHGTFVNEGGSTGGAIETGLRVVEGFFTQAIKSTVLTDETVVNATLETAGNKKVIVTSSPQGNITIVTQANLSGFWMALGV